MRLPALILVALAASACSESDPARTVLYPTVATPPAPPPHSGPSSSRAFVIGIIIGESPQCIVGASVRVLDGQRAGESITQETPCDVWGYYGGFEFDSLSAGVPMKLRASAHGYADYDTTVYPTAAPQPYTVLKLSRAAEK